VAFYPNLSSFPFKKISKKDESNYLIFES